MSKELKDVDKYLDLDRTNGLFDSSIGRSDAHSGTPYDAESLKAANLMTKIGNMHLNTARVKVGIQRVIGYKENLAQIKKDVDRKVRRGRKR